MPLLVITIIGISTVYYPAIHSNSYYFPKFLFLLLMTFAIIVELIAKRRTLPWKRLKQIPGKWWLVGFYLFAALSTIFSPFQDTAFLGAPLKQMGLITYLCMGIVFIYSTLILTEKKLRTLLIAMLLVASVLSIIGLFQFYRSTLIDFLQLRILGRGTATIGSPNAFGTYLTLMFLVGCALYLSEKKPIFLISTGLVYTGLLTTTTRSAWIASFVAFLLIALYFWKQKSFYLLCGTLFLATALLFVTSNNLEARFNTASQEIENIQQTDYSFGSGRGYIWSYGWNEFKRSTIKEVFLGTGPDTFYQRVNISPEEMEKYFGNKDLIVDKAFNIYLEMALTFGLPALFCLIIFFSRLLSWRIKDSPAFFISLMLVAYLIQGFFTIDLISIYPIFLILLAGLGYLKTLSEQEPMPVLNDQLNRKNLFNAKGA